MIPFILLSLIGYIMGGIVGIGMEQAFNPYSWYGMLVMWALMLASVGIDVSEAFD